MKCDGKDVDGRAVNHVIGAVKITPEVIKDALKIAKLPDTKEGKRLLMHAVRDRRFGAFGA